MEITQGSKTISIDNKKRKAIIEFDFDNYILYVFQGTLSTFDIFLKYKKGNLRIRTPKHIHWAVDVLVKLQGQKRLTKNDYFTLSNLVKNALKVIKIEDYKKLDYYGEYPVDFLFVLMLLLSIQEKTNRIDAYMFGSIIDELLESNYDIFRIVSKAGYSGRK